MEVTLSEPVGRIVSAVHGRRTVKPDPSFELGFVDYLRKRHDPQGLAELYGRCAHGESDLDALMRRVVLRALAQRFGDGVEVGRAVVFRHPETFQIGNGVFIGEQVVIQGRAGGSCTIGDHVWLGPQAYFDARDLVIEECVGWGPGAKVLGSTHTGVPVNVPIMQTNLEIRPVRIGAWTDIGGRIAVDRYRRQRGDPARRDDRARRDRRCRGRRDRGCQAVFCRCRRACTVHSAT